MQLGDPSCGGQSHQYHQYYQWCVLGAVREDVTESEHEGAVGAGAEVGVGARCGVEVEEDGADVGGGHEA